MIKNSKKHQKIKKEILTKIISILIVRKNEMLFYFFSKLVTTKGKKAKESLISNTKMEVFTLVIHLKASDTEKANKPGKMVLLMKVKFQNKILQKIF